MLRSAGVTIGGSAITVERKIPIDRMAEDIAGIGKVKSEACITIDVVVTRIASSTDLTWSSRPQSDEQDLFRLSVHLRNEDIGTSIAAVLSLVKCHVSGIATASSLSASK